MPFVIETKRHAQANTHSTAVKCRSRLAGNPLRKGMRKRNGRKEKHEKKPASLEGSGL